MKYLAIVWALVCLSCTVSGLLAPLGSRVSFCGSKLRPIPAKGLGAVTSQVHPSVSPTSGTVANTEINNNGAAFQGSKPLNALNRYTTSISDIFRTQLPMLRYLWPSDSLKLRAYLVLSMVLMFTGKWFSTRAPFMLQRAIDGIPNPAGTVPITPTVGVPLAMALVFYGLARILAIVCDETKTCLFTNVSQSVLRKFAHQIFSHLHTLGADFHLQVPSGVISVAYVRAVRGFQALMFQLIFSVGPVFLEMAMVARILSQKFSPIFAAITTTTFVSYLVFTLFVTQWRVRLRREIVNVDNARNGFFIDSLLNHEVVKLFNNEDKEIQRFDTYLDRMKKLNIDSTYAIALLNIGQAVLFSAGLTASLLVALKRVQAGSMTVGDLVAVNAMILQLVLPFDCIGYTYQELRQSLVDMSTMTQVLNNYRPTAPDPPFALPLEHRLELQHQQEKQQLKQEQEQTKEGNGQPVHSEGKMTTLRGSESRRDERQRAAELLREEAAIFAHDPDASSSAASRRRYEYFSPEYDNFISTGDPVEAAPPHAQAVTRASKRTLPPSSMEFRDVTFTYKKPATGAGNTTAETAVLLDGISFKVNAGENVAIVGPSGSGKSTVLKLITRMIDADSGEVLLDGVDIAHVTKASVRRRVAVVPQDTCLFDDTVGYNIRYGSADASDEEAQEVVRLSNLQDTVARLPPEGRTPMVQLGCLGRAQLRRSSLRPASSGDAIAERVIIVDLSGSAGMERAGTTGCQRGGGDGVGGGSGGNRKSIQKREFAL